MQNSSVNLIENLQQHAENQKIKITMDLCRHNVQITIHDNKKESAVASSIFVSYKGSPFLLTSGHIFSESSMDSFGVNISGTWYRLPSFSDWLIALPNENEFGDDCAMFLLNDITAALVT